MTSLILIRHWPIRRRENCGRGCDLDVICFTLAAVPMEWKPTYIFSVQSQLSDNILFMKSRENLAKVEET